MFNKHLNNYKTFFIILPVIVIIRIFSGISSDVDLYSKISSKLLSGQTPFLNNFYFEYPPITAYLFGIVGSVMKVFNLKSLFSYNLIFILMSAFFIVLSYLLTIKMASKLQLNLLPIHVSFCLFIVEYRIIGFERYDIFPAFLVLLSLYIVQFLNYRNVFLSGLFLGLAICLKLYPVILLPLYIIYILRESVIQKMNNILRTITAFGLGLFVAILPTAVLIYKGFEGIVKFYQYHSNRGFEVTSIGTTLALGGSFFGVGKVDPFAYCCEYGSYDIVYTYTSQLKSLLNIGLALLLGLVLVMYYKRLSNLNLNNYKNLIQSSYIFVLLFVITNKVFSTQYFIWLLSLGLLTIGFITNIRTRKIAYFLFFSSMILNSIILNYFWRFETEISILQIMLINLKNILFWLLFMVVFADFVIKKPIDKMV